MHLMRGRKGAIKPRHPEEDPGHADEEPEDDVWHECPVEFGATQHRAASAVERKAKVLVDKEIAATSRRKAQDEAEAAERKAKVLVDQEIAAAAQRKTQDEAEAAKCKASDSSAQRKAAERARQADYFRGKAAEKAA